ncbi:hypothetical protein BHM03_00052192 [Ensete ventricosum]|nr:hypothetical protein BHM03_00052192 [Ensete ventricosum]
MCSFGSELPSYASSVGSRKLGGISLSWIFEMKSDLALELSPSSSFDLTNSFYTSSKHRLIWRNCALRESVESEERVPDLGKLGVGVLEVGTGRLATGGRSGGNSEGSCGLPLSSCCGTKGPSRGARRSYYAIGETFCWGTTCCAN